MSAQKYRQMVHLMTRDTLIQTGIDFRDTGVLQRFCPSILDNTDHSGPGLRRSRQLQVLPQGLFIWPIRLRHGLIDYRDPRGLPGVEVGKETSAQQCHAHQVKVFWRYVGRVHQWRLVASRLVAFEDQGHWRSLIVAIMP